MSSIHSNKQLLTELVEVVDGRRRLARRDLIADDDYSKTQDKLTDIDTFGHFNFGLRLSLASESQKVK